MKEIHSYLDLCDVRIAFLWSIFLVRDLVALVSSILLTIFEPRHHSCQTFSFVFCL